MCFGRLFGAPKKEATTPLLNASSMQEAKIAIPTDPHTQIRELKDAIRILENNHSRDFNLRPLGACITTLIPVGLLTHCAVSATLYYHSSDLFKNAISTISNATCWATYSFTNHAFSRSFDNMNSYKCEQEDILTRINRADSCYGLAEDTCYGPGMTKNYLVGIGFGTVAGIAAAFGTYMIACCSPSYDRTAIVSCSTKLSSANQEKITRYGRSHDVDTANLSEADMLLEFREKLRKLRITPSVIETDTEYDMSGMTRISPR